jgi:hypothetical protein
MFTYVGVLLHKFLLNSVVCEVCKTELSAGFVSVAGLEFSEKL